jgi:fluoride exporter
VLIDLVVIAVSGAVGAVARYLSYVAGRTLSPSTHFPVVTLLINVTGCLLIGLIMVFVERAVPFHRHLLLVGVIGFLGSFTTFSTFGFETLELVRMGHIGWAVTNAATQVVGGVGAVWLGRIIAHSLT